MAEVASLSLCAVVESLEKSRQPLTHLEAIYIMVPTDKTIQALINDFDREPRYKAGHVYFLESKRERGWGEEGGK